MNLKKLMTVSVISTLAWNTFAANDTTLGLERFSKNLTSQYLSKKADENFLISPKNVGDALALLALGSGENSLTRTQLQSVFSLENKSLTEVMQNLSTVNADLTKVLPRENEYDPTPTKINLATSLWANDSVGFQFNDNYVEDAKNLLNAEVKSLAFSDPKTIDMINSWVNVKTEGMIPVLFNNIPADSPSVLVSTLFIEGSWAEQFLKYKTQEKDFTLLDGTTKKHELMEQTERLPYLESNIDGVQYQYVALETADYRAKLEIYLPESLEASDCFRRSFLQTTKLLPETISPEAVKLTLPKFKAGFKDEHMEKALLPIVPNAIRGSDYSLMSDFDLEVGQVVHQTLLEVKEEGFRAAAATGVVMRETSIRPIQNPIIMTVNRPFGIRIVAKSNGEDVELFKGWIANPETF